MTYTIHAPETAPDDAKDSLAGARRVYGFVPNLLGAMAEAPALLKSYLALSRFFDETSLSPTERQTVLLSVSRANGCEYCVAAHTAIAAMQGVADDVVGAVRTGEPLADGKLEALRRFTVTVVESRGWPTDAERRAFVSAGYANRQVLEVVLGVGLKTLSNYTNHLAATPLDEAFASAAWSAAEPKE